MSTVSTDDTEDPGEVPETSPSDPEPLSLEPARGPRPGDVLGHFVVERHLGSGGMGVVYLGHDPALDRPVALKLIRGESVDVSTELRARLAREAQALSKVVHPNVVAVYEAGTVDHRMFIAMEYVEGGTLGRWLRERNRSIREIVDVFVMAGRGLRAVHAAGLVHRDFKPTNVLVGTDGRVKVTDFGVVGLTGTSAQMSGAASASPDLTAAGGPVGTPRYMAPEQHGGERVDPRADQFAFAVSLYEAVMGRPPFGGGTVADLQANVRAGHVRPFDARVPGWLRRAIRRGLAARPDDRHPSMDALLARLERGSPFRARRVAAAVAAALALAGGGALVVGLDRTPCRGAERRLAGVWDEPTRAAVRAAFVAADPAAGGDSFARVAARFDDYGATFVAAHTEACEATRVRGDQSEALMDKRIACLDRRLAAWGGLTTLLARKENVTDRATSAAVGLARIADCADAAALAEDETPPATEARPAVEALRQRLAQADAHARLGNLAAAAAQTAPLVDEARRVGHAPLLAQALALRGELQADGDPAGAEATLKEAIAVAADARNDALVARAMILLFAVVGAQQHRVVEALALRPAIDAAIRRMGNPDAVRVTFLERIGTILMRDADKLEEAVATLRVAEALAETTFGRDSLEVGRVVNSLAAALTTSDHLDDGKVAAERALAIFERELGPESADVGTALGRLGVVAARQRDFVAARRYLERNLALKERHFGRDSAAVAMQVYNLGRVATEEGRLDDARGLFERSLAIREKVLGPDHPDVSLALAMLADVLHRQGKLDESRAMLERALAAQERRLGPDHPDISYTLDRLADVMGEQHHLADAVSLIERSVAIRRKAFGPRHVMTLQTLAYLGQTYLDLGRPVDALAALEPASALSTAAKEDAEEVAVAEFALARALRANGRDPARARALAVRARARWAERDRKDSVARVDRWLAQR
jgi:tetratricopeptide (TPR) repeat protein/predicted Ser/Thr protein kinase